MASCKYQDMQTVYGTTDAIALPCSFYRDFSGFNNRAPGTPGQLQAYVNSFAIPTNNTFSFTTQPLSPASIVTIVRTTNPWIEQLPSNAPDVNEGLVMSIQ